VSTAACDAFLFDCTSFVFDKGKNVSPSFFLFLYSNAFVECVNVCGRERERGSGCVKAEALMQRYKRFRFLVLCFISQRYLYSESKKKKTQEKKRGYPLSFSCFFFYF
jgi:hypothetical protein